MSDLRDRLTNPDAPATIGDLLELFSLLMYGMKLPASTRGLIEGHMIKALTREDQ